MSLDGMSPRGRSPRGGSPRGRSMSPSKERFVQQEYWREHTSALDGATVNAMMLDSQVIFYYEQNQADILKHTDQYLWRLLDDQ